MAFVYQRLRSAQAVTTHRHTVAAAVRNTHSCNVLSGGPEHFGGATCLPKSCFWSRNASSNVSVRSLGFAAMVSGSYASEALSAHTTHKLGAWVLRQRVHAPLRRSERNSSAPQRSQENSTSPSLGLSSPDRTHHPQHEQP